MHKESGYHDSKIWRYKGSIKLSKVNKIDKIKKIRSNQSKSMFIKQFFRRYLVEYILREQGQKIFDCVWREQKQKNKACILAPYQDMLIFSLLEDTKID